MIYYRLHNPTTGAGCEVASAADRDTQLAAMGPGTTVEEFEGPDIPAPDPAEKLQNDIDFGNTLIKEFLLDNRNDPNVKTSDSLILLQKFQAAKELLSLGDIRKCVPLITAMTTDSIFTIERKTKYLNMISSYLAT